MTSKMVTAVAATGQLGTGFKETSLRLAAARATFIACDAGSTDPGPYYLGSGESQASDAAISRDLSVILAVAFEHNIPVLIGSAGTAGGRPHVQRVRRLVDQLAAAHDWSFPMAVIDTQVSPDTVIKAYRAGRLRPLPNAPDISVDTIRQSARIVAMAGPEPFQKALHAGAQVVLAGRSSDTSLFVALPAMLGIPMGVAYHAAKVLECGAASAVERLYPDSMMADLDPSGFTIEPPNPAMRCTPQSVASHTLYENGNPFVLVEPGGTLNTQDAKYLAQGDRAVRVTGSRFTPASEYTVRLEAAALRGYRTAVLAGIRDPLVLRQLDAFVASASQSIARKVADSLNLTASEYTIRWRLYGKDGCMGSFEPMRHVEGHEVGVVIDVVAQTQELANAITSIAWHTALHHPIPEYSGLVSNLAFPFSPPALIGGAAYEFVINHAMVLNKPEEAYSLEMVQVGPRAVLRV